MLYQTTNSAADDQGDEENQQKNITTPVIHSEFYSTGIADDGDDGIYKGSGIVQLNLENEYQILGRIPLTTMIQYIFNAFLILTAFSGLCLIVSLFSCVVFEGIIISYHTLTHTNT